MKFFILFALFFIPAQPVQAVSITNVTDNRSTYTTSQIPKFSKLEITFNLSTVAQNTLFPYDPTPPPGVPAGTGVTVYAKFTAPNAQVYQQPAFQYQVFDDQVKSGHEWFYPTSTFLWKVRFSPDMEGTWRYTLVAQDAGGTVETTQQQFTVGSSSSHGFIKPSRDPRYFEYEDGTYFPSLGYNLNGGDLDNVDPVIGNTPEFSAMGQNGIQLSRVWVSQFSIYGEAWSRWASNNRAHQTQEQKMGIVAPNNYYLTSLYPNLVPPTLPSGSEYMMWLEYNTVISPNGNMDRFTPCRYAENIAVKQNTVYRVKVRYQTRDLEGPKVAGQPYGFTVKTTTDWWGANPDRCNDYDAGTIVAATYNQNQVQADPANPGWSFLTGTFTTSNSDYLKYLYVSFNNLKSTDSDTKAGHTFIDHIWLEEASCTSHCPNLITKADQDHHFYINQRDAYSFDKVLNLAEQNGLYLKAVMNEKNDRIFQTIDFDGNIVPNTNGSYFYGNRRVVTKVRWLQQAWWRYMQARWGYSPYIHSWELLNEGEEGNAGGHWDMADEFGKYMKCRVFGATVSSVNPYQKCQYDHPNSHMVSTSFWGGGYPWQFWNNQSQGVEQTYAEMDYADQHYYADIYDTSVLASFYDSAQWSYNLSTLDSNWAPGKRKPFMRGEAGWSFDPPAPRDVFGDGTDRGEWLHDYIWAGINRGGLMEHYFAGAYFTRHIYYSGGTIPHDYRPMFKTFYNFIKDVPLNNTNYQDAAAVVSNTNIHAWGQKDLVNKRAHIWIANKNHTWYNAMGGYTGGPQVVPVGSVTGTVTISGFTPNTSYPIEWWNTYTGAITSTTNVPANSQGQIVLTVSNVITDVAVRIGNYTVTTTPTPIPLPNVPGDATGDGHVNNQDFIIWKNNFAKTISGPTNADFDNTGKVDGKDFVIWLVNYGQ